MKKYIPAIILLIASIALAIVSYILLPDSVTIQMSIDGSGNSVPKIFAVAIPTLMGAGGAIVDIVEKHEKNKPMFISIVGIIIFAIMITVNLIK